MTNGYQKSVQTLIKKIQIIAFIIAGIIVVVVVYTSISKWKVSEEEELIPSEEEVTPAIKDVTVTIESASCVKTSEVKMTIEDEKLTRWNVYEVHASGTVTGPPGAVFSAVQSPILSNDTASCTTWTGPAIGNEGCSRENDPSSSSWSYVILHIDEYQIVDENYTVNIVAYVTSPKGGAYGDREVRSIVCPH